MSLTRLWKIGMQSAPRLVSLTVLFAVCCSLIPLPVGQRVVKDLSQPFPCQQRACGCRSADQCWKKCCCFTNSQKVAWAKAYRVIPPPLVVSAARRECSLAAKSAEGCCVTGGSRAVPAAAAPADDETTEYLVVVLAQQCQGQPWAWSVLPWAVMPQPEGCSVVAPLVGEKLTLESASLIESGVIPPVPPPRHMPDRISAV